MSQPQKKKSSRKGGSKTDSAKSKQGAGMSTRASEEKSKPSEPGKVEAVKPMSSTSKSSVKPGSAATQKSADSCKSKTKSGSVLPGAAGGVKQQQPQSTATSQSKMGQLFGKTSNLDTKENQDRTHPEKLTGTSLHKNNDSKIQDGKPMLSTMEQLMEPFPSQGPDAPIPKCTGPAAKDEDPFDLLAGTLPSEEPDKSIPEYTGPKVKESDATKKKGERVGEHEDTIPPDYRFKDQPDPKNKDKPASSSTGPGTKLKTTEKTMTQGDVFESLAADFGEISAEPLSKSSAATAHSAPPPPTMKQATLQASTAATVSTSRTVAKDKDAFDLLADSLPSEAPDTSGPKYTGPPVKESDVNKQHVDRMGDRDDTLPPDYRFKDQPAPKDKGPLASSTDAGAKPKIMTEGDVLESLSADFAQNPPATISIPKCSAAIPQFAEPPSPKQQPQLQASKAAPVSSTQTGKKAPDKDSLSKAPLQASKAAPVSASLPGPKDNDAFDLLAQTLPSEAPDDSAPKYTGPPVKEPDTTKKLIERMGDRDETIPPEYRFKEQPDPKGKGQLPSSADPAVKPKTMTDADVLESLSADLVPSLPATIPKCSAAVSHSAVPPSLKQQAPVKDSLSKAPLQASKAAPVSASLPGPTPPLQASKAAPVSTSQTSKKAPVKDSLSKAPLQASKAAPVSASLPGPTAPDKDSLSKAPLQASKAAPVSASLPGPKGKDPFALLAETLPSEAPDDSTPKYTGPEVKESDATKKKGERVGERDDTIPPDYRFKELPGPKDKLAPSPTGTGAKPKTMTEGDVMDYMSADIMQSSTAPISKCSAATIHAAAPPSMQIEAPLQASKAAAVSAGQTGAKLSEKVKDPLDLLAETLPSEAPDDSSPKFTGLAVKESDVTKKKGERVGEHESTIPPDYRFKEQTDPKDKGKLAPSFTDPGAKPKVMTDDDILDSLSGGFGQSSVAPISKCSVAPTQFATLPSKQKEEMTDDDLFGCLSGDFVQSSVAPISKCSVGAPPQFATLPSNQKEAPLKATAAAPVSASQTHAKGIDPFDLLAASLPSEAPDNSAPKFSGPEVKEADAKEKSIERLGERESTIPPEYRYGKQPDSKDKGKPTSSVTSSGAKPKTMTEDDVLTSLSADLVQSSAAQVSKCSAPVSHVAAPHSTLKQEPLKASTAASVSANQSAPKGKDPFDLLAKTLPSEAPDKSAPKYTGPAVKESDSSKKKAELVGETDETIPPDYRFTPPADPKDKGKSKLPASSTGAGTKPKAMAEGDAVKALSADFVECSAAPVSKCSAPVSHTVAPPSLQKPVPLQASTAASVSSSQGSTKDKDPFDLLADSLPSEAPDTSGPKYTGPPVKESDVNKKKAERVGEIEESIPPDYRLTEQTDPKDKGKPASSFVAPGAKPKLMKKEELIDRFSSDFDSSSSASHSVEPVSKQKESKEKPAAKPDTKKARKC
ncbi:calpastatin isoform X8 [Amblyraja radiata]|uniref:calpastatin isoform X8 n=1 Tax=Amblyraja radiata TaxID=386614 RepID=UPI0014024551|nr:calpastatin isoform X8 [Amblyraja radiata]